jgi:hypothetical protein
VIKKSVITIAVGNEYYYELTRNLVRSFLIHNSNNRIKFNLVTDNVNAFNCFKEIDRVLINAIDIANDEKSFTAKFYLLNYALEGENLFIDCDCLVYKDLTPVFNELTNNNFTALGTLQTQGDFFCDISKVIKTHKVSSLPVFVGSVYFFKKNEITKKLFEQAFSFKEKYDELGFIRLRGKENEEPLLALAMALNGELPYSGDLNIKADAMFYSAIDANVIKGTNSFQLLDKHKAFIYNNSNSSNAYIVHYNASYSDGWLYQLEQVRLKNIENYSLVKSISAIIKYEYYGKLSLFIKNTFRPTFRLIFGKRKIKPTVRTQHLYKSK